MTETANKATLRHCIEEVWSQGRVDRIADLVHPLFRLHHERNRDQDIHGPESFARWVAVSREAFPDLQVLVHSLVEEGDRVLGHFGARGTHNGRLKGVPATGTVVDFSVTAFIRFAEGKIVEAWAVADTLGILRQVGALPKPGAS